MGSAVSLPFFSRMEPERTCKLCSLKYPVADGRVHGRFFTCTTCASADRALRRNLGSQGSGLDSFSTEESCRFFRNVHRKKQENLGGRLLWTTLRATLVTSLTERRMQIWKTTLRGKHLPLSVWIQQGWPKEVVEAQPNEWSEEYKCQVYCVNVKELSWQEEFNGIEQQILQHEQEIAQKGKGRKKKAQDGNEAEEHSDQGEMDLPSTEAEKKTKEKNPEAAAKKERAKNMSIANRSAKALGPLQQSLTTLTQLEQRLGKSNVTVDPDLAATCQSVVGQLSGWTEAARSRVAASSGLIDKGGESAVQLEALPFEAADQKMILQQAAEVAKGLRALLPKPKAKAKAEARSPAGEGSPAAGAGLAETLQHSPGGTVKRPARAKSEAAPKRRRVKSST